MQGELTVDELMKQIDDYMDYYNRERCSLKLKKLSPVVIQNPACTERLNRLFMSVQDLGASSTRFQVFRRPFYCPLSFIVD